MTRVILLSLAAMITAACTPTVKLEAPDKPIEINLNVKVQQEIRVKVEKELENDIMNNPELFGIPTSK
jgi:hypothetical protein